MMTELSGHPSQATLVSQPLEVGAAAGAGEIVHHALPSLLAGRWLSHPVLRRLLLWQTLHLLRSLLSLARGSASAAIMLVAEAVVTVRCQFAAAVATQSQLLALQLRSLWQPQRHLQPLRQHLKLGRKLLPHRLLRLSSSRQLRQ